MEHTRVHNNTKEKFGQNSRSLMKNMKKLTSAGQLVEKGNTHEIGMDLLSEVRLRKTEAAKLEKEKSRKKLESKFEFMDKYVKIKNKYIEQDETK